MKLKRYSIKSQLQKLRYILISLRKHQNRLSPMDLKAMKAKIKELWIDISSTIGSKQLRRCLGGSLMACLMITSQAQAQNFADPVAMHDVEFNGIVIPQLGDLDGDGDLDIVGSGFGNDVGSLFDLSLCFQENIGADPQSPELSIPEVDKWDVDIELADDVYALDWEIGDLDNDGDLDLLGFGLGYDDYGYVGLTAYVENIGTESEPNYGDGVVTELNLGEHLGRDITLVDFDDDGDLDVMFLGGQYEETDSTEVYFFNVLYYENIGNANSFELAEAEINPGFERLEVPQGFEDAAYYFSSLDMADFDEDGDLDALVIVNSYDSDYGTKFMYSENTGNALVSEFGPWIERENLAFITSVEDKDQFILSTVGDLDGDGDVDLFYTLAGEYVDNDDRTNTYFVENTEAVSSTKEEIRVAPFYLFPTITSSNVNLVFDEENTHPISILSANGKLVKQFKGNHWLGQQNFDVSDLTRGQYFVRIVTKNNIYSLPFVMQ